MRIIAVASSVTARTTFFANMFRTSVTELAWHCNQLLKAGWEVRITTRDAALSSATNTERFVMTEHGISFVGCFVPCWDPAWRATRGQNGWHTLPSSDFRIFCHRRDPIHDSLSDADVVEIDACSPTGDRVPVFVRDKGFRLLNAHLRLCRTPEDYKHYVAFSESSNALAEFAVPPASSLVDACLASACSDATLMRKTAAHLKDHVLVVDERWARMYAPAMAFRV